MVKYNVSDLNTDNGKLRRQEQKLKALNKHNIRDAIFLSSGLNKKN